MAQTRVLQGACCAPGGCHTLDAYLPGETVTNSGSGSDGAHVIDSSTGFEQVFEQAGSRFFAWSQDGKRGDLGSSTDVLRIYPATGGAQAITTGLSSLTGLLHRHFAP